MPSSSLLNLHAFHQHLLQKSQAGVQLFQSRLPAHISSYAEQFQHSLPSNPNKIEESEFFKRIAASNVVLFGDYHTLPQSQEAFCHLLETISDYTNREIQIALEVFSAEDQALINDYLSGAMPEEYFLRRIDYQNKWGFPWENYRTIVEICMRKKIRIHGINSHASGKDRLHKRDVFAGKVIEAIASENPESLVICLIGEYHLGDGHLPARLPPHLKTSRIVSNIDEYAFASFLTEPLHAATLVLKDDFYCVINTAPWLKWQSLAMWEEIHGVSEQNFYGDDSDAYTEQQYDIDYQLLQILQNLNEFLQLGLSKSDLSFDLYYKPDDNTFTHLRGKHGIKRSESLRLQADLEANGFAYIPRSKVVILDKLSLMAMIKAAGCVLYDCLNSGKITPNMSFMDRLQVQMAAQLSALILDPRRQILTRHALEDQLQKVQKKRLTGSNRKQRDAGRLTLNALKRIDSGDVRFIGQEKAAKDDLEVSCLYGRFLAEILCDEIFSAVLEGKKDNGRSGLVAVFTHVFENKIKLLSKPEDEQLIA